jgi:hypothetical protein
MSKLNVGVVGVVGSVVVYMMWEIHGVLVSLVETIARVSEVVR